MQSSVPAWFVAHSNLSPKAGTSWQHVFAIDTCKAGHWYIRLVAIDGHVDALLMFLNTLEARERHITLEMDWCVSELATKVFVSWGQVQFRLHILPGNSLRDLYT